MPINTSEALELIDSIAYYYFQFKKVLKRVTTVSFANYLREPFIILIV